VDLAAAVALAAVAADSARPTAERLDLLGVPLDAVGREEIEQRIAAQLGDAGSGLLHVVTLNPEYVIASRSRHDFREAVEHAELSVPDGAGVVWAVRWLYGRRISRVTGVDLASWLLSADDLDEARSFLLGTPASIAELQGRHPLRVAGRWGAGRAEPADDAESIERIRESGATVVLVGYGAPAQVLWIERNRAALDDAGVRIAIGVGGALDYLAGTVRRAPEPVRALGLEWAYRLVREPWRWRRQLALPKFAILIARARFHGWISSG
jgi:N-acetylglucosaminyldiphosphoundecaprenol N-acetyl-beta-D-mannosaminyltransferase